MQVAWINSGNNSGDIASGGINRKGIAENGESTLIINPQELNYVPDCMNHKFYKVVNGVLSKKDQVNIDEVVAEDALKTSLANKLTELKEELDSRVSSIMPKSNSKNDLKIVSRQLKLLNKKFDGRANPAELAELEASEALDDYLDALTDTYDVVEVWLEDSARTLVEIEAYDVVNTPVWPVA